MTRGRWGAVEFLVVGRVVGCGSWRGRARSPRRALAPGFVEFVVGERVEECGWSWRGRPLSPRRASAPGLLLAAILALLSRCQPLLLSTPPRSSSNIPSKTNTSNPPLPISIFPPTQRHLSVTHVRSTCNIFLAISPLLNVSLRTRLPLFGSR